MTSLQRGCDHSLGAANLSGKGVRDQCRNLLGLGSQQLLTEVFHLCFHKQEEEAGYRG